MTQYIESFVHGPDLWIVMEYLAGGDLHALLKRVGRLEEPLVPGSDATNVETKWSRNSDAGSFVEFEDKARLTRITWKDRESKHRIRLITDVLLHLYAMKKRVEEERAAVERQRSEKVLLATMGSAHFAMKLQAIARGMLARSCLRRAVRAAAVHVDAVQQAARGGCPPRPRRVEQRLHREC